MSSTSMKAQRSQLECRGIGGAPAGNGCAFNIGNGGGSSPTIDSPAWGVNSGFVCISDATFRCRVSSTSIPGAGTVTLGVFWARFAGAGAATPQGTYEFYVEAIGSV